MRAANVAIAPTGLLCDLLEHPEQTVITTPAPEFGWEYNPSFPNDGQSACHIIVSSTPLLAAAGVGNVWDSGVVSNSASINLTYAGTALQTATDYYWCVQTVDSTGQKSPLSAAQHFRTDAQFTAPIVAPTTTGLQWIWYSENPAATYATRYFIKTFVVSTNITGAQIYLTADDQFILYVNGNLVGNGINWKQFQLYSLNSLLHMGTNTIAIQGSNILYQAGLTARLDYLGVDGSTNSIFTDGTWLTSSNFTANWNQPGFADSSWSNAEVLGAYGISPWDTTAALPANTLIYNVSTNVWAHRYPPNYNTVMPVLVTNTAPNRWFIDFGQDSFGYVTVHLNGSYNGTVVKARFGEMSNGFAVNTSPPSAKLCALHEH